KRNVSQTSPRQLMLTFQILTYDGFAYIDNFNFAIMHKEKLPDAFGGQND
ncbi:hypothetical protein G3S79_005088, partial [Escherichia coli]|nr:hypothetical protein [Escherichia coli]EFI6939305.1 hypothetical protein [Escherichia coli]EFI9169574.1 hypothetical protein [Escherichia coli]EFJ1085222.1 hypothetical protein [Escherichia coli]